MKGFRMNTVRNLVLVSLAFVGAACGSEKDGDSSVESAPQTPETTSDTSSNSDNALAFTGYILNAFNVTVDGEAYADLEDFYTKEIARLPEKAKDAGYDESYKVEFDAQIGFKDLWLNMQVFLAPEEKQGFQGSARVDSNGKFSVSLPDEALDTTYRVRANKRISVVISKDGEVHKSCYNFSAIEKSIPFAVDTKPIVLDTFGTTLTAYDCESESDSGIQIPEHKAETGASTGAQGQLRLGMAKSDVLNVMGRDSLKIVSAAKWCWTPVATDNLCAVNYASDCRCSVSFDGDGILVSQDNIRAELLDVASW